MRIFVFTTLMVVMVFGTQNLNAQESGNETIGQLLQLKKQVVIDEREALKKEVSTVNDKLALGDITMEEAQKEKEFLAKNRALNIENKTAIIDNKLALIKRNGEVLNNNSLDSQLTIGIGAKDPNTGDVVFGVHYRPKSIKTDGIDKNVNKLNKKKVKYDRRTKSSLLVAFGFNNTLSNSTSLEDSNYKLAGSRFFEMGWLWSTRVFRESNFLRLKYGISYMSNGLKINNNRYFVDNRNQIELETFDLDLEKSKFRVDHLVFPFHFEFGPSKLKKYDDRIRYQTAHKFRIGLGGFVGVNINTLQKLKYEENGEQVKDKIKSDYNTSDLIYGLSGYIGFGDITFYLKYDRSPVFKNAIEDEYNISLGLRFDL